MARQANTGATFPTHEQIVKLWFNEELQYTGPGGKGLQHCTKCHCWKYEHRYEKFVLKKKSPSRQHVCVTPCPGYDACPTRYKEGHPEITRKEEEEKAALRLSTPAIKDWAAYEKYFLQAEKENQPNTDTDKGKEKESEPEKPRATAYIEKQLTALRAYREQAAPRETTKSNKCRVCCC